MHGCSTVLVYKKYKKLQSNIDTVVSQFNILYDDDVNVMIYVI